MTDVHAGNFGEFCAALRKFRKVADYELQTPFKGVYRFRVGEDLFSVHHPNWLRLGDRNDGKDVKVILNNDK